VRANPSKIVSTAAALVLSLAAVAGPEPQAQAPRLVAVPPAAPHCDVGGPVPWTTSIGLSVEYLLPNDVKEFPVSVVGYGLSLEVPTGPVLIRLDGGRAGATNFSMAYGTVAVKIPFETPFMTPFLVAGGHYIAFWLPNDRGGQWGGLLGIGVSTAVSRGLRVEGTFKGYLQGTSLTSIAIGIQTPL
jgi:hypothetical protein